MAKVLLYNIKDDYDIEKFNELANSKDIGIIRVEKDEIDQHVGYLLGFEGYEKRNHKLENDPSLDFPFILFAGFERDQLFEFLDLMRENKLTIQHKAGETHNNVKWTLRELLIENDKEGKTMGLIHRINGLLDRASELKAKHGEDQKLKELVDEMQAYFDDSSLFDLDVANKYYVKLLEEILRVEEEHS